MRDLSGVGQPFRVRSFAAERVRSTGVTSGRRTRQVGTPFGTVIRHRPPQARIRRGSEVAIVPTVQAAGLRSSDSAGRFPLVVLPSDYRRKVRLARVPNFVLFVVDASGSMAARQRMEAVRGAILSMLLDAYQKRDTVGMIAFRGEEARLVLPPIRSIMLARRLLERLPTGGRTPLANGLKLAEQTIRYQLRKTDALLPLMVLLSDGRANAGGANPLDEAIEAAEGFARLRHSSLVIDCERGYPQLGLANRVGAALGGEVVKLGEVSAETVKTTVNKKLESVQTNVRFRNETRKL